MVVAELLSFRYFSTYEGSQKLKFRERTKKERHYGMAAYISGLLVIYRLIDVMRLDSYDNGQTGKYTQCRFATLCR